MGKSTHRFCAREMRKISHPVFKTIDKYWLTVAAKEFPPGISTSANARDPVGLNRRVYKDVRSSLDGITAQPGSFDLMNKGITILARSVKLVDKENGLFDITIDNDEGGIVDGAHTARIIEEANRAGTTPEEQYVEVYIRTGVQSDLVSDIARGLNTGIQVAAQSIYNIAGVFDWLKEEIKDKPYEGKISWNESDDEDYDVRDLIAVLEVFNIFDFPNDLSLGSKHPIAAYEKWSTPLRKFAEDYEEHKNDLKASKYYRLRKLLNDGLVLYDYIRHDFREMRNEAGGSAGKMNIVEETSNGRTFEFPFAGIEGGKYRLTKGATFPILAAFRTYVELHPKTGEVRWRGGFERVLQVWKESGPSLVEETYQLTREGARNPDQVGKNRKHWGNLYMQLQVRLLQERLNERERKPERRRV